LRRGRHKNSALLDWEENVTRWTEQRRKNHLFGQRTYHLDTCRNSYAVI
jgi:hypothetical protein